MAKGETRTEDIEGSIDPELGHEETTMFRAVAARLNDLSCVPIPLLETVQNSDIRQQRFEANGGAGQFVARPQ